mmetsp:Transcript_87336/g.154828  ORF Transcript_87336/g.154828 Transcript_87336/m.154828 type:complete len:1008 (+) Transcript_87336:39-3062(+)|eukprot:CAMPEP_0197655200 /NCGR_PEP_ID=MMETSP1338-20131121/39308_1 /TAXON_ID=43686 ORGANISM="Pelagodinium beii, Strain RCC1491" /NCGR_SAMPLE_ID=MMETSP1338 /ASSEMBLY_ACC=CAM_ASM_000754 /LENGTH=1007 /DNA_ID=CAMNT_0043230799 /DNA_START=39 /DNA_END=3062 /DNA_ORIENTATION=+
MLRLPQVKSEPALETDAYRGGHFGLRTDPLKQRKSSSSLEQARRKEEKELTQDEAERLERRERGQYGLSNKEKACFARILRPTNAADYLDKQLLGNETGTRSAGELVVDEKLTGSAMPFLAQETKKFRSEKEIETEARMRRSSKGKRRGGLSVEYVEGKPAGTTALDQLEDQVSSILRILFPSNPSSMARVGSSYRRNRVSTAGSKRDANTPSTTMGLTTSNFPQTPLTTTGFGKTQNLSSTMRDGARKPTVPRITDPLEALQLSIQKIPEGVEAVHLKQMVGLLKREINLKLMHIGEKKADEKSKHREPLYVPPAMISKTHEAKASRNNTKYASSGLEESWVSPGSLQDSKDKERKNKIAFRSLQKATDVVGKIRKIQTEVSKDKEVIKEAVGKKAYSVGGPDDNFSLREFRERCLEMHGSLTDAFRNFDEDNNHKLSPKEWGTIFKGKGLATYREARIIFELIDLNHDGSVSILEFHTALEAVAPVMGIDGLRKRLVCLGYKTTMQAFAGIDGTVDPSKSLSFEEFSAVLQRLHVVESEEHRVIWDNVRDRGEIRSRASVNDLIASLSTVSSSLLLEEIAEKAFGKWGNAPAIWAGLGPEWGEGSVGTEELSQKLMDTLGLPQLAAEKAPRILDVDENGEVSRSELLSALALARPSLQMEDFRRKVQQRFRSIEAAFRASFEHLEDAELNNDDDLRLHCDEFAEILESLDLSRSDTVRLFRLADANETGRLTLYEFFRGVKIFVPGCVAEGIRIQALSRCRRIADAFRECGIPVSQRLHVKAFQELLDKTHFQCEDTDMVFDFLDARTCGTVCISEVVAALQSLTPGSRERKEVLERERLIEKEVRQRLAPLYQTVDDLKTTVKKDLEEDEVVSGGEDAHDGKRKGWQTPKDKRLGSKEPVKLNRTSKSREGRPKTSDRRTAADRQMALARKTFQRIDTSLGDGAAQKYDYCNKRTVDGLCGYFASTQVVLGDHEPLLHTSYSRTDWHKQAARMSVVLNPVRKVQ